MAPPGGHCPTPSVCNGEGYILPLKKAPHPVIGLCAESYHSGEGQINEACEIAPLSPLP